VFLTTVLQQILSILLVLGLLTATLVLLRRRGLAQFSVPFVRASSRPKEMQVLERIGLSPQHSLHLVQVRSSVILIGLSPSGCNRIATFGNEPSDRFEELAG
jgi:flagellar biogenesis protein FliO